MGSMNEKKSAIQKFIQQNVRAHPRDIVKISQERFNLTRPAIMKYLNELIDEKRIQVTGKTRDREYTLLPIEEKSAKYQIVETLEEGNIWRDFSPLFFTIPENVKTICQYGFTEMVNNAIEHSEGSEISINISISIDIIEILIADNGVGIFNKIQKQYGLADPIHSILELAKGKLTTDARKHSGEGIFFTSRAFDTFYVQSGKIGFIHTNEGFDYIDQGNAPTNGTSILMTIARVTQKLIQNVFDKFTNTEDDFGFDKTIVPVHLATYGDDALISRSQARRVLARFERFKTVILDFKDVKLIGQSFADEIFRVFVLEHPGTILLYTDANSTVEKMIKHAQSSQ